MHIYTYTYIYLCIHVDTYIWSPQKLLIKMQCVQAANYNKHIIHHFKILLTLAITFPE